MKKKLLLLSLILILAVSAVFAAAQEESNTIIIASDATWPPMEFIDVKGDLVGFDIDMLYALAEEGGFEVDIRNTAWDGIFAGLKNGAYDAVCSSVTITEDRQAEMAFTESYINAGQILIVKKSLTGINGLGDMAGMKVGVQNGTTGDFALDDFPNVERRAYDEVGFAVEDLMNGQVDGVVCDSIVASDYVLTNEAYSDKLMIVGEPFTDEFFGIAVQKDDADLLKLLNDSLAAIKASGKLDELINKWLR
ncbi:MAG: basic amino acid ABC transporter substrate-binding protein [Bacteroidetes bacterium]|nr:basic amino acid ABC transporter substrate-binding protein [Bacteroidota bacterium]